MDDLSFRKAVYADPFTKDQAVIDAAQQDANKKNFWDELKAMENELQQAMNIPVPENLAERLILRQSLTEHKSTEQRRPWYLALAASVVLASVVSFNMLSGIDSTKFENDVFAHMHHVDYELAKSGEVDMNAVNAKLASFNGSVDGNIGDIVAANYCYLDKIKSLHVIIRGEEGLTSLFVVPDSITESISESFSDASFKGAAFLLESAKIIIVGESDEQVENLKARAKSSLSFSA